MTIEDHARELLGDVIGRDIRHCLDTDSMAVTIDDALTAISAALSARASAGEGGELTVDVSKVSAAEATALGNADFANFLRYLAGGELHESSYQVTFAEAARRIATAAPQPAQAGPAQAAVKESLTVHPAHGDGEVLGFLRKFDADFIARKQHGQCQVIIYQERPRKDAVPLYTATRPTPEARDAARWRALIGSARIRVLGSAGLLTDTRPDGGPWNGYAHIGLELWTQHEAGNEPADAAEWLTKYADAALALPTQGEG